MVGKFVVALSDIVASLAEDSTTHGQLVIAIDLVDMCVTSVRAATTSDERQDGDVESTVIQSLCQIVSRLADTVRNERVYNDTTVAAREVERLI